MPLRSSMLGWIVIPCLLLSCVRRNEETKPIRKDITEIVFASGTLEAEDTYELTAQTDGYLQRVEFDENDLINPGQILAEIQNEANTINARRADALYTIAKSDLSPQSPQLLQAKNSLESARHRMQQDSLTANRYEELLSANAVAKIDFEKAELAWSNSRTEYRNARAQYDQLWRQNREQFIVNESQKSLNRSISSNNLIRAVIGGKVYKKLKQTGNFVQRGEPIAVIGNAKKLYARVNVDERSISKIKVGQPATVQLNVDIDRKYDGTVSEILPMFYQATQSFICKIQFSDTVSFGIVSTQLQANIVVGSTKNALLIPRSYLNYNNEVRLKDGDEPIKVATKIVSTEWVQVVSGLDENSTIVHE